MAAMMTGQALYPPLPLADWLETKETLHLFLQIVGKIRLNYHPKLNHWWHVTFYLSSRGLTTGRIPYQGQEFEIEFDFIDHRLLIRLSDGQTRQFALPGLSVADFYRKTFEALSSLGLDLRIYPCPYLHKSKIPFAEDRVHKTYDAEAVHRYWRILARVGCVFESFRGRFCGKSTPVHVFWHSMDLALTRFSGWPAPPREGGTKVDKEAYSHEVISFGFWPGDDKVPEPAFYSYAYPEPPGLAERRLAPKTAFWADNNGSHMALLRYKDFRIEQNPDEALLAFLESAYQAAARLGNWPIEALTRS
jgi:hypothetical protein